jgi:hypothetical protein
LIWAYSFTSGVSRAEHFDVIPARCSPCTEVINLIGSKIHCTGRIGNRLYSITRRKAGRGLRFP